MKNYFLSTDTVMAATVDATVNAAAVDAAIVNAATTLTDDQVMALLNATVDRDISISNLIDIEYTGLNEVFKRKIKIKIAPMNPRMHKIVLEDFMYKMKSIPCQYSGMRGMHGGCYGTMAWVKDIEGYLQCKCTRHRPVDIPSYNVIHMDFKCDSSGVFCQQTMVKGAKV